MERVREEVLRRWHAFPVHQTPRPIVLLDVPVHLGPRGFINNETKTSWMIGTVETAVALPDGMLDLITESRAREPARGTVAITSARPRGASFRCDRGPRLLAAYQLTVSGLRDLCTVLDPTIELWWPRLADDPGHRRPHAAAIEHDDRTLHFPALGGYYTAFHGDEFAEYPTCVVGHAITSEKDLEPGAIIPAMGVQAMVPGQLRAPLDGRVLLHESGEPVAVLPAGVDGSFEPDRPV